VNGILAIDPGTVQSAWLMLVDGDPTNFGIFPNDQLLERIRCEPATALTVLNQRGGRDAVEVVVIEQIESFGMAVGREVFETVHWSGRFTEAAHQLRVEQLSRRKVKTYLCGSAKAKDANIRQALIDKFGGQAAAVGLKASPGPLYGISKDVWSALAIAVTWAETGS
jgi:hypothetical protein